MPLPHDQSSPDLIHSLFTTASEKAGAAVSIGMIMSPWWMADLKHYSDIAALFAPILGCIYLSLQIGFKMWDRTRNDE